MDTRTDVAAGAPAGDVNRRTFITLCRHLSNGVARGRKADCPPVYLDSPFSSGVRVRCWTPLPVLCASETGAERPLPGRAQWIRRADRARSLVVDVGSHSGRVQTLRVPPNVQVHKSASSPSSAALVFVWRKKENWFEVGSVVVVFVVVYVMSTQWTMGVCCALSLADGAHRSLEAAATG